jgi:hypothetical protein
MYQAVPGGIATLASDIAPEAIELGVAGPYSSREAFGLGWSPRPGQVAACSFFGGDGIDWAGSGL